MRTIWKYEIEYAGYSVLKMPKGAKILSVQVQYDKICLWAEVDDTEEEVGRKILMHNTGGAFFDTNLEHRFLGTVQLKDGEFVWHLYEVLGWK